MITRRTLLATSAAFALTLSIAAPAFADPDTALAKLQETVLSKGPNGEEPAAASWSR